MLYCSTSERLARSSKRPCGRLHGIESRLDDDDDSARNPSQLPTPKLTPIPSDAGEHPPVLHDEGDVLYVGHRVQPLVSWYKTPARYEKMRKPTAFWMTWQIYRTSYERNAYVLLRRLVGPGALYFFLSSVRCRGDPKGHFSN